MNEEIESMDDSVWKTELRDILGLAASASSDEERRRLYTKVGYYYHCCAPCSLYKYYPNKTRNLDCVANHQMWYSAPINFNDVFDCDVSLNQEELFKNMMNSLPGANRIKKGSAAWRDLRSKVFPQIAAFQNELEKLRENSGVVSLSESCESLLMWAHYASNHQGMCVEYDLLSINQQLKFTPVPVIYSSERFRADSFNINSVGSESFRVLTHILTSKSLEWSYEKEWRIIRDDGACGEAWNQEKHGALLQMIRPSSITLGCAASGEFEEKVTNYCNKERVDLYKMKKDKYQYRLIKETVLNFGEGESTHV